MPSSTSARSIVDAARSRASCSIRSCVWFRMKPAGPRRSGAPPLALHVPRELLDPLLRLVPHEAGRHAQDALRGIGRPLERRDQRILLVVARNEPRLARGSALGDFGRTALDLERRSRLLLDHLTGEVER